MGVEQQPLKSVVLLGLQVPPQPLITGYRWGLHPREEVRVPLWTLEPLSATSQSQHPSFLVVGYPAATA